MTINWRDALIITRFDYRALVRSAPGVIFLVIYFWLAIAVGGNYVSLTANAEQFVGKDVALQMAVLAQAKHVGHVGAVAHLVKQPHLMSLFFIGTLMIMPPLVMLLSFSQSAGYIRRKTIRYIVPKTGRFELYFGLFLSCATFYTIVWACLTAVITLGFALAVKGSVGTVIAYSLKIHVALWFATIPLIAFMSMLAGMIGSPIATAFVGPGTYLATTLVGFFISRQTSYGEVLYYLLPLEVKYYFLYGGAGRLVGGALILLGYTAVYLALGWLVLRRRNL